MLGMGMDLPLLDWLNTYTFKTEAAFKDTDYARGVYQNWRGNDRQRNDAGVRFFFAAPRINDDFNGRI